MTDVAALLKQAGEKREMAALARRWARGLASNDAHAHMIQQAEELEAEAGELERQAAERMPPTGSAAPPVQQQQTQQQQQHEAEPTQEPKPKP